MGVIVAGPHPKIWAWLRLLHPWLKFLKSPLHGQSEFLPTLSRVLMISSPSVSLNYLNFLLAVVTDPFSIVVSITK